MSVADKIRNKIRKGHSYVSALIGNEVQVALYYGPGECSSAFVSMPDFSGPARPLN